MNKILKRTIVLFIALTLIAAGLALAQDVIEGEAVKEVPVQSEEAAAAEKQSGLADREAEILQEKADALKKMADRRREIAEAEKELEDARKQMKAARKRRSIVEDERRMYQDMVEAIRLPKLPFARSKSGGGGAVLVVPSAEMKLDNLAAVTEDMSVMSRIFDRKLNQSNVQAARGEAHLDFNPFFGHDSSTTQAVYLEGYAVLFLVNVDMPLSPPAQEQKTEEAEEQTDPVWTQVRKEIYEPEEVGRRKDERREEKYDAEKVEMLKTNLIKTLKHAAIIRALEPGHLVILTVIGDRNRRAGNFTNTYRYGINTGSRYVTQTAPDMEAVSLQPSVLTISAKKADIDAFAEGRIDYNQFRQRMGIFKSYAKAGQQASPDVEVHQVAHDVHTPSQSASEY
jgi:hypothetical protein